MFFLFKQKTSYDLRISDWSSDVCSSDLLQRRHRDGAAVGGAEVGLPFCLVLLAAEANPVIRHAARIDAGIEQQVGQVTLALLHHLDAGDRIGGDIGEIDVDQRAGRPAGLEQLADYLRRMRLCRLPLDGMAMGEDLAERRSEEHPSELQSLMRI